LSQVGRRIEKTSIFDHYKNNKMFFVWDIAAIILIVAAIVASIFMLSGKTSGEYVEIYHKGNLLEVHPLHENKTIEIEIEGHNTITIKDAKVYVSHADCPDKLCVKSRPIKNGGERIICAPNGLVVIIRSDNDIDGITGGRQ
jgi:hypothetical protein